MQFYRVQCLRAHVPMTLSIESTGPPMDEPRDNSGPPMEFRRAAGFSESGDFPVWNGRDLVGIVIVLFVALFLADSLALLIANSVSGMSRG